MESDQVKSLFTLRVRAVAERFVRALVPEGPQLVWLGKTTKQIVELLSIAFIE
jgi:hypothetical protein